jgi:uncharacterized protein YeaO (DUF488 family)
LLKQASIAEVKDGLIQRGANYIVVTMRFYPRFLPKELRHEFICDLAPQKQLLLEFNAAQKRLDDHNSAFAAVDYEQRFTLNAAALAHLERLSELSKTKEVYLACICSVGQRCHREMLMLLSRELFGCTIGDVHHSYPVFMKRLHEFQHQSG